MTAEWDFTSPIALLGEWQGATARGGLHDVVLLGFTVNLPFLEKVAIRPARDLGARVIVIGDAAQGVYDPVDVRLRSYVTGWATCGGAFHPKLAMFAGEHDVAAAIGSGNPTMAGWGHNDEIWTVLRSGPDGSAAGLRQLGAWLDELPDVVAMPGYAAAALRESAAKLAALPGEAGDVRLLHNLRQGLLAQLPGGPARELCLFAPFVDETGAVLAEIIERFDPERVVIGLQEHLTSYDGDAVLRAARDRDVEVRLLPQRFARHGKLLEWDGDNGRHALVGSANLTASALARATVSGGNCELAVLAPVEKSLMPNGTVVHRDQLGGRRTVAPAAPRPGLLLLGALLVRGGIQVTLARGYDVQVKVEASPDGSPGSWLALGTIPPGVTEAVIPVAGATGTVVRAVAVRSGQRVESPPVFAVNLAWCARRRPDDRRPRLQQEYSEETIFADEEMAQRFRADLLRLAEASLRSGLGRHGAGGSEPAPRDTEADRWAAYLEECERSIGRPFTVKLFGPLAQMIPGINRGPRWGLSGDVPADDDGEPAGDAVPSVPHVPPSERVTWARWITRLVKTATGNEAGQPALPLSYTALVTRIMIQLLAHGVWESGDESWRAVLAQLALALVPGPADDTPGPARQLAAALAAVCMGLLRSGVSITGGTPQGVLAARTWKGLRHMVGDADPDLVSDLLITPVHAHAVTLNLSELEDTILLAMDDDPAALLRSELAERGWQLSHDGLMYRVTGPFSNPMNVAAQVATRLGRDVATVLVLARAGDRWAFIAWRRPDLLLANEPGHAWRLYRIDGAVTPESRFAGAEGIPVAGLIGRPVPFSKGMPPAALDLCAAAGADPADVLARLLAPERPR